ncbi:uncharacterized protein LOC131643655 [Vicia villosa]|uniref:uncharacterized protein LOC131643655 n=1 Tax=Vicia villosa TaxID=3911 RepID=UPI00273A79AA|nr:uncharacterized protein LOC131643655 [Vicia villosa]
MVSNSWFDNKDFLPFVEKEWGNLRVEGRGDFVIKENLRLLKNSLRRWNVEVFRKNDLEIEEGIKKINEADDLLSCCKENQVEKVIANRSSATSQIWMQLKIKENMIPQKSRLKCNRGGDSNSRFFHCAMKGRRKSNFIGNIITNNGVLETVGDVKEEIKRHFIEKFTKYDYNRPFLEGVSLKSLSSKESDSQEAPFSNLEIK